MPSTSSPNEPSALEALVSVLYDEDTAVVQAAADALLRRGDERAFEPLLRALNADEPDFDVADEVQDALLQCPATWFEDRCIATLEESDDHELRAFAADALGYPLHATRAVAVLERALNDASADVREAAADALMRLRPPETHLAP
jgi:HEAT repeat protein